MDQINSSASSVLCRRWRLSGVKGFLLGVACTLLLVGGVGTAMWYRYKAAPDFEIVDPLGGNIFPSAILSVATTGAQPISTMGPNAVGNTKNPFAIRLTTDHANTRVRIELDESPFYARSVSEFELPQAGTTYTIYPDVIWHYDRLKGNKEVNPVSVVATVKLGNRTQGQQVRTFSFRGINECLFGYKERVGNQLVYRPTNIFFAAYVDEDNAQIDGLLREALNTRIVKSFMGYQGGTATSVDRQVFALWYVLQQRRFRYSSVSNTSLSSNVAYSQRVRTFGQALKSSQVNCVDGSVLFASLLRAINITPVLVKTPGHMFVGYHSDGSRRDYTFLETTMIGNIDLDDYFPEEKLDSTRAGMTQREASRLAFDKAKEYAEKNYVRNKAAFDQGKAGYVFLEISKQVRRDIQPLTESE